MYKRKVLIIAIALVFIQQLLNAQTDHSTNHLYAVEPYSKSSESHSHNDKLSQSDFFMESTPIQIEEVQPISGKHPGNTEYPIEQLSPEERKKESNSFPNQKEKFKKAKKVYKL